MGADAGDDLFQTVDGIRKGAASPVDLSRWEPSTADAALGFVRAARAAGLECLDVTPAFREASPPATSITPMDGHFNPAGNAVFGQLMADAVRAYRGDVKKAR